jgi:hypothetical protein
MIRLHKTLVVESEAGVLRPGGIYQIAMEKEFRVQTLVCVFSPTNAS